MYCDNCATKTFLNMNNSLQIHTSDSLQDYISVRYVTSVVIFYTCLVIGIIGNSVVIFVYGPINDKQRSEGGKDYRAHVRYYIPSLAVCDTATLIFGFSFPIRNRNVWLCKASSFLVFSSVRTSGLILLLIAMQRFMFIALQPKRVLTIAQLRGLLLVAIVTGALLSLPEVILLDITNINVTYINRTVSYTACGFGDPSAGTAVISVSFATMLVVIAFISGLYTYIARILVTKLKISSKKRGPGSDVSQAESSQETVLETESREQGSEICRENASEVKGSNKEFAVDNEHDQQDREKTMIRSHSKKRNIQRQKAKLRFIVMFFIIIVFYAMSYTPYHVIELIALRIQDTNQDELDNIHVFLLKVLNLYSIFGFVNHIVNPFIYGYFDAAFKEKCTEMFNRYICK